jgi:signal transduction histidine kinase/ActR/RegA family two-component response regulator
MINNRKTKGELISELEDLHRKYESLKVLYQTDINRRELAEQTLWMNAQGTEALLKLNQMTDIPLQEIIDFVLEESVRLTQSTIGYVAFLNENESEFTMHSWPRSIISETEITETKISSPIVSNGLMGEAIRMRRPVINNDYEASTIKKGSPEGHVMIKRHINVPIFGRRGIVMVASVGNKNEPYDQADTHKLTLLMEGMWRLIERKQAEALLQEKSRKIEVQNEEYQQINEELIQINEELLIAKEKVEENNRLKSAFLANMSHEIRTPMNGILGFSELLKEPGLSGENQTEFIEIIQKSGARMLNIINDLMDISKIESGQMEVSVSEVNINDQIEYIYNFFKPEAEQKDLKINLQKSLSDNRALINTDNGKLIAILSNIVKNAIKFTDTGIIEIGYDVADVHGMEFLKRTGSVLRFYVKDTGIGIPADRQLAIFDRFVQADISDVRAFQGAGLGLSISKAYVEMLGGTIWLESTEGEGSTFYFTIPYNLCVNVSGNSDVIPVDNNVEILCENLKILIVEDDEVSEWIISLAIKPVSREVLFAASGIDALNIIRNHPDIDLILMDIKMPGMDGYETTRKIREFNKEVVIIAQTAFALIGDKEKAIEAGCNDYVSKPIQKEILLQKINRLFVSRQSMIRLAQA